MKSRQEVQAKLDSLNAQYYKAMDKVNNLYSGSDTEYVNARKEMNEIAKQVQLLQWILN